MTIAIPPTPPAVKKYRMKLNGKVTDHRVEMRMVPIDKVHYDVDYQRPSNPKWLSDHLPFVAEQAGTVVLSLRGERLWCVDGRHRISLADLSHVNEVRAFVIYGMTKADEAGLFVRLQRERRALSAWDLFRAEMASGDPETHDMVRALHRAGFRIDQKTSGDPKVITAIDSVRFVYRLGGSEAVTNTLQLIVDSMWLNLDRALSGPILKGLAIFLHSELHQPGYDEARTVQKLRTWAPSKVLMKAQQISIERQSASVSATNVAEAVLAIYNDRIGSAGKLPGITFNKRKRPAAKNAGKVSVDAIKNSAT